MTSQRFILKLKFNEKVKSPGVPDFGVFSPRSCVLGPDSQDPGPEIPVLGPGSWISWALGPGSWVPGSYFRPCRGRIRETAFVYLISMFNNCSSLNRLR